MAETVKAYHRTLFAISVSLFLVWGCASQSVDHESNAPSDIQVSSHGYEEGGEFCKEFNLTPEQAEEFFSRATELDARRLHDQFDILPCWVRGQLRSGQGESQWEIRAGGTARIVSENGTAVLLGCDECDDLLSGEAAPPPKQ